MPCAPVTVPPTHSRWLKLCHKTDFQLDILRFSRGSVGVGPAIPVHLWHELISSPFRLTKRQTSNKTSLVPFVLHVKIVLRERTFVCKSRQQRDHLCVWHLHCNADLLGRLQNLPMPLFRWSVG